MPTQPDVDVFWAAMFQLWLYLDVQRTVFRFLMWEILKYSFAGIDDLPRHQHDDV